MVINFPKKVISTLIIEFVKQHKPIKRIMQENCLMRNNYYVLLSHSYNFLERERERRDAYQYFAQTCARHKQCHRVMHLNFRREFNPQQLCQNGLIEY